ncbi:hypothetical protein [Bradyrhizobium sp.]|uniref:hypothetical protein n=1 Tax=Bradyrhizobium sp. TaxID=376 RepID=UPI003C23B88D
MTLFTRKWAGYTLLFHSLEINFELISIRIAIDAVGIDSLIYLQFFGRRSMRGVFKLLGVVALVVSSIGQASALTLTTFPVIATGAVSDFVFTYSTSTPFTLSNLSLFLPPSGSNILGGTLATYTTPTGGSLSGSGSLSEIISTRPGASYEMSYAISGSLPNSISVALVPLPASAPLFVMALIGLGMMGYRSARGRKTVAA